MAPFAFVTLRRPRRCRTKSRGCSWGPLARARAVGAYGIDNGHPRPGLPYVLLCDWVTYPPHPSLTTVVVPPSLLVMCRPTSPASFRLVLSRRLTFAPGGRLVRVLPEWHTPLRPAVDCPAGFQCLPAQSAPSLPPPALSSECWRRRPRAFALIAPLAPGRQPALLAQNSFEVPALRYLRPLVCTAWAFPTRRGAVRGRTAVRGGSAQCLVCSCAAPPRRCVTSLGRSPASG